jgi:hypothetical protein
MDSLLQNTVIATHSRETAQVSTEIIFVAFFPYYEFFTQWAHKRINTKGRATDC